MRKLIFEEVSKSVKSIPITYDDFDIIYTAVEKLSGYSNWRIGLLGDRVLLIATQRKSFNGKEFVKDVQIALGKVLRENLSSDVSDSAIEKYIYEVKSKLTDILDADYFDGNVEWILSNTFEDFVRAYDSSSAHSCLSDDYADAIKGGAIYQSWKYFFGDNDAYIFYAFDSDLEESIFRQVIWTNVKSDIGNIIVADREYGKFRQGVHPDKELFNALEENGFDTSKIFHKKNNDANDDTYLSSIHAVVELKESESFPKYKPYIDTFCYFEPNKNVLSSYHIIGDLRMREYNGSGWTVLKTPKKSDFSGKYSFALIKYIDKDSKEFYITYDELPKNSVRLNDVYYDESLIIIYNGQGYLKSDCVMAYTDIELTKQEYIPKNKVTLFGDIYIIENLSYNPIDKTFRFNENVKDNILLDVRSLNGEDVSEFNYPKSIEIINTPNKEINSLDDILDNFEYREEPKCPLWLAKELDMIISNGVCYKKNPAWNIIPKIIFNLISDYSYIEITDNGWLYNDTLKLEIENSDEVDELLEGIRKSNGYVYKLNIFAKFSIIYGDTFDITDVNIDIIHTPHSFNFFCDKSRKFTAIRTNGSVERINSEVISATHISDCIVDFFKAEKNDDGECTIIFSKVNRVDANNITTNIIDSEINHLSGTLSAIIIDEHSKVNKIESSGSIVIESDSFVPYVKAGCCSCLTDKILNIGNYISTDSRITIQNMNIRHLESESKQLVMIFAKNSNIEYLDIDKFTIDYMENSTIKMANKKSLQKAPSYLKQTLTDNVHEWV